MKDFDGARTVPTSIRRVLIVLSAVLGLLAGTVAAAMPASAEYGKSAVYQIELSANLVGQDSRLLGGEGGGVWLWIELSSDHTGDYSGADCGHGSEGSGAAADMGEVTWWYSNGMIIISGVVLNGLGGYPTTITVPDTYGHYSGSIGSFLTLPFPPAITSSGFSQLQVAP
jgi:hypothetical protein